MKFLPAICPQCSASLDFNDTDEFVVCSHCKTKIHMSKEQEKSEDFDKLLNLAKISEDSENFAEAFQYYSNALLLNSESAEAWRGKGYAAGMLSNLVSDRLEECINCHNQSLRVADEKNIDALKMEYALSLFQLARSYFDLSLEHTMKFIAVPDAQYEHADRCRSIIGLCEYALSLDPDLSTIKTFINDIASRCEKIRFLDGDSKSYFVEKKDKYQQNRVVESSESTGNDFTGWAYLLVIGSLVANYFIATKLFGIENPIFAFFIGLLLFIPEGYILFGGFFAYVKMRNRGENGAK